MSDPYRTMVVPDLAYSHDAHDERRAACLLCRVRAKLARVSHGSLVMVALGTAFVLLNAASAVVAASYARLAEQMLAASVSLSHVSRAQSLACPTPPAPLPVLSPVAVPLSVPPGAPPPPAAEADGTIHQVGAAFSLDRNLLEKAIEGESDLRATTRIVPERRNGTTIGIRLYGIRPGTLPAMLGLENGDALRKLNGFDISTPEETLAAYARLRTARHLRLDVNRGGHDLALDYYLK